MQRYLAGRTSNIPIGTMRQETTSGAVRRNSVIERGGTFQIRQSDPAPDSTNPDADGRRPDRRESVASARRIEVISSDPTMLMPAPE